MSTTAGITEEITLPSNRFGIKYRRGSLRQVGVYESTTHRHPYLPPHTCTCVPGMPVDDDIQVLLLYVRFGGLIFVPPLTRVRVYKAEARWGCRMPGAGSNEVCTTTVLTYDMCSNIVARSDYQYDLLIVGLLLRCSYLHIDVRISCSPSFPYSTYLATVFGPKDVGDGFLYKQGWMTNGTEGLCVFAREGANGLLTCCRVYWCTCYLRYGMCTLSLLKYGG